MRRSLLAFVVFAWAAASFAQNGYTLVLGRGPGYINVANAYGYKHYGDLEAEAEFSHCGDMTRFAECVLGMMTGAGSIIFLLDDGSGGFLTMKDASCDRGYTECELSLIMQNDNLHSMTRWFACCVLDTEHEKPDPLRECDLGACVAERRYEANCPPSVGPPTQPAVRASGDR